MKRATHRWLFKQHKFNRFDMIATVLIMSLAGTLGFWATVALLGGAIVLSTILEGRP